MMLWFAFLLFLVSAPGSESRLLPQEQLRVAKELCEGEADSLLSSASALFVSSRSLLADSKQLPSEHSAPNVEKFRVNGVDVDHAKQLLSQLASIQSTSRVNDLKLEDSKVVRNPPASLTASEIYSKLSSPSGGNNLMVEAVKKDRTLQGELLTRLSSSVPSGGDHMTVEKRQRSPPAEYQILYSGPSGEDGNHLTVQAKQHRSPPAEFQTLSSEPSPGNQLRALAKHDRSPPAEFQTLSSSPSTGDHLTVQAKQHRSPPAEFQTLSSEPSTGNQLRAQAKHDRSPPAEFQTLSSGPSTGDHLTVQAKQHRSPPAEFQTLSSEPSTGDHLTVQAKQHRSPPAEFQTLSSGPSTGDHLTVQAKHQRSPPAEFQILSSGPSPGDHQRVQANHEQSQPAIGSEILANLQSSTPSCCNQLVVEPKKTRAPPAGNSGVDFESVEGLRNRNLGDSLVPESREQLSVEKLGTPSQTQKLGSYLSDPSNQTPPAGSEMKHTQREASSVDSSQKVGCTDSIFDSLDMIAQQFANSIRRLAVYS